MRRLIFFLKHRYFSFDNIFFVIALMLCIVWATSAISAMSRNWQLTQVLAKKQHELALLRLEVETAELENAYYRSEEYLELSARAKQNKQLPGEHLVYLPANSEQAKTAHQTAGPAQEAVEPSNFSQWMSFLLGK